MKNSLPIALILSSALTLPGLAFACSKPEERPEIPDPDTAVTAQMVKANNDVRAYVQEVEAYIACARLSPGQQRREVTELKEYADAFNVTIRAFRERTGG